MNYLHYLVAFLIILNTSSHASAPGTHVFMAELWMDANGITSKEDQEAFIAGSLFPDIRYLGTISREKTHEKRLTPKKIRNTKEAFIAGMRLHAFQDKLQKKFTDKSKIYKKFGIQDKKQRVLFRKMLEDEILWSKTSTNLPQTALSTIYPQQIEIGVDENTIHEWHETMTDYFKQLPSEMLKENAKENKGFLFIDAKTAEEWSQKLPKLASDPIFIEFVNDQVEYMKRKMEI